MAAGPEDVVAASIVAATGIKAAEKFLGTLLGPAVKEVGELLADPIREYRKRRAIQLLADTQRKVEERGATVQEVPGRVLFPLLENASLDDELHDRWVALLANAADAASGVNVTPAFPRLLAELSAVEVRILDWIVANSRHITHDEQFETFWITVQDAQAHFGMDRSSFETLASNSYRLGIAEPIAGSVQRSFSDGTKTATRVYFKFLLTPVGVQFVRACKY